jgi:hypothetical protein
MIETRTRTWTGPSGEKMEIEVGSEQERELLEKLHTAGLWEADDPNKPDGCIVPDDEWLEKQRKWNHDTDARLQEYHERQVKKHI